MCRGGSVLHSKPARGGCRRLRCAAVRSGCGRQLNPDGTAQARRTPSNARPERSQHEDQAQSRADRGPGADVGRTRDRRYGVVHRRRSSRSPPGRTAHLVSRRSAGGDRKQASEPRYLGYQHLPRVLVRLPRTRQRRAEHLGRTEPARAAPRSGIRPSAADSAGLVLGPLRAVSLPAGSPGAGAVKPSPGRRCGHAGPQRRAFMPKMG